MSIICSINKELSFWFKHAELRYWAIPEIRYTSPKEDMEIPPKFYQHFAQEIKTRGEKNKKTKKKTKKKKKKKHFFGCKGKEYMVIPKCWSFLVQEMGIPSFLLFFIQKIGTHKFSLKLKLCLSSWGCP